MKNYSFSIFICFVAIVGLVFLFLAINGIISLPQRIQTSHTSQIMSELEQMSPNQLKELKGRLSDLEIKMTK